MNWVLPIPSVYRKPGGRHLSVRGGRCGAASFCEHLSVRPPPRPRPPSPRFEGDDDVRGAARWRRRRMSSPFLVLIRCNPTLSLPSHLCRPFPPTFLASPHSSFLPSFSANPLMPLPLPMFGKTRHSSSSSSSSSASSPSPVLFQHRRCPIDEHS